MADDVGIDVPPAPQPAVPDLAPPLPEPAPAPELPPRPETQPETQPASPAPQPEPIFVPDAEPVRRYGAEARPQPLRSPLRAMEAAAGGYETPFLDLAGLQLEDAVYRVRQSLAANNPPAIGLGGYELFEPWVVPRITRELARAGVVETMSKEEWEQSRWYRKGVPFDDAMTEHRARAIAEIVDRRTYREWLIGQYPNKAVSLATGFAVGTAAEALNPINYLFVLAPPAGGATGLARVGQWAYRGALENLGAEALSMPTRIASDWMLGDKTTLADAVFDLGVSAAGGAVMGGVIGPVVDWRGRRAQERVDVDAATRVLSALALDRAVADIVENGTGGVPKGVLDQVADGLRQARDRGAWRPGPLYGALRTMYRAAGRPEEEADYQAAVAEALFTQLQQRYAPDLTMEEVLQRAGYEVRHAETVPGTPGAAEPRDIGVAGVYLQEAWHGSPHRFQAFEARRGSGQGAASFGAGDVYAAESRSVAETYRVSLSADGKGQLYRVEVPDAERLLDWDRPWSEQPDAVRQAVAEFAPAGHPSTEWRDAGGTPRAHNLYVGGKRAGTVVHFYPGTEREVFTVAVIGETGYVRPGAQALQGPFRSLEEAKAAAEARVPRELTGEDIYAALSRQMGSAEAASAELRRRGLLGIRYLDAGSRPKGEGTANFVVFDAGDVKIQETYYQAAALRAGSETLEPYGIKPGERAGTMRVALALEARTVDQQGKIGRGDHSPEAAGKIAGMLADELGFELDPKRIRASARGWYGRFQKGLDIAGKRHPELVNNAAARATGRFKSRKEARDLFTLFTAISSQGIEAGENFGLAGRMFDTYVATGRIPSDIGRGEAQTAIAKNVAKVQKLINTIGLRKTIALLLSEDTVSINNRRAKAAGLEIVGGMGKDERVPLAAVVLGPKIGAFFANLSGKTGYLTMDLWWTRQINRLRGDMQNRIPGLKGAETDASGNPVGLARFKQAIGKPEISDDDALALVPEYAARAEEKYRASIPKTEAEAAAQYLHGLRTSLREQPDGVADRSFMLDIARRTQQLLRDRGHDLSIADIQAIAWYYEKRLYAEQGARETPARSYEEAAKDYVEGKTGRSTELPRTGPGELPGTGSRERVGRGAGFPGRLGPFGGLDPRRPPGSYRRGNRGLLAGDLARSLGGITADDIADVHTPTEAAGKKFRQARYAGPALAELVPTPAGVNRFIDAISQVTHDPNGAAVEIKSADDYQKMRLFLAPDGTAGFALNGEDIVSLFRAGGPHQGVTMAMLQVAVREGGRRLDCFDTVLPKAYSEAGFRAVARIPWNDVHAPPRWDKQHFAKFNNGEPDVVFMVYDPTHGRMYKLKDGERFAGWDEAAAQQQAEVERLRGSKETGVFYQSAAEPAPPFFSALTRAVEGLKQPKAKAQQWAGIIRNLQQKRVRKDETEWSAVLDWLDEQGDRSISRDELVDYLRSQEVVIEERIYGAPPRLAEDDPSWVTDETEYKGYKLRGGRNYREFLLRVPDVDAAGHYRTSHWASSNVLVHVRFTERSDAAGKRTLFIEEIQSDWHQAGRKKGYRKAGEVEAANDAYVAAQKRWEDLEEQRWKLVREVTSRGGKVFYVSDLGLRADYLPATTAAEAGTLHAEFSLPHAPRAGAKEEMEALLAATREAAAELKTAREAADAIKNRPPDAPLKTTWHEAAFRRMVRWAAENGFDRVAWTTGKQQAERYDLSRQVSRIVLMETGSPEIPYVFAAYRREGERVPAVYRNIESVDELEELIGKELTQKLLEAPGEQFDTSGPVHRTLEGLDLAIGGEGMSGFYDRILPAYAAKFGKKFGSRVGTAEIRVQASRGDRKAALEAAGVEHESQLVTLGADGRFRAVDAAGNDLGAFDTLNRAEAAVRKALGTVAEESVHAIDITPAMRETALSEGFPLWQGARTEAPQAAIELADDLARIWLTPRSNESSLIHENGHAFLELLRWSALRAEATDAAKTDWGIVRTWLGAADEAPLSRDQHERFAKAFERFLAEGEAPSQELAPIFQRFKDWMIAIYRTVSAIAPEVPEDVKAVMGRMMASDEQIARARMANTTPPPRTAPDIAPPLRLGEDDVESLARSLGLEGSDDAEIRLAQIEGAGRLHADDRAALDEADEVVARAARYARAYQAAAACMV